LLYALFAGRSIATLASDMSRQKMGQHFLGDLAWRNRIFATLPRAIPDSLDDVWIEIGAGHGEMTELLAADGRRVIAVEADPPLATRLRQRAADWPSVEVIEGDILDLDFDKFAPPRFRVYGNLPYYITSPILHRLFAQAERIASIHIVVQLEVAERIVAPPGRREYGYLSAACQFYTKPEIMLRIPPGAFRPPPKVKSAFLRMMLPGERPLLGISDDDRFLKFVQMCFGQKRKTLRNNLRSIVPDDRVHQILADCGLPPDVRAEQLSLAQFARLFANISWDSSGSLPRPASENRI
jgi:16S rRNA (adenine1518-N6/adenine1519-N6)-dimethyltransferase